MSSWPDLPAWLSQLIAPDPEWPLDLATWGWIVVAGATTAFSGVISTYIAVSRSIRRSRRRKSPARSYVLDLLLPIRVAHDAQASLEEVMPIWIAEWGPKRARRIRRLQIFLIVAGHYTSPILTLLERVLKIVSGRSSAE